jgi:LmbE family N-acetylglucosaminyl deacetylase
LSSFKSIAGDSVLVLAPHPDDEALGCGGTLARLSCEKVSTHVVVMTGDVKAKAFDNWREHVRADEIGKVRQHLFLNSVSCQGYPASTLHSLATRELIDELRSIIELLQPETLFLPWIGDIHSDHQVAARVGLAAAKSFRTPTVKTVLFYETLSETNGTSTLRTEVFSPQLWIDVSSHLDQKLNACLSYATEFGSHPFPRSELAVRSLAALRGSECGVSAAESFVVQRLFCA